MTGYEIASVITSVLVPFVSVLAAQSIIEKRERAREARELFNQINGHVLEFYRLLQLHSKLSAIPPEAKKIIPDGNWLDYLHKLTVAHCGIISDSVQLGMFFGEAKPKKAILKVNELTRLGTAFIHNRDFSESRIDEVGQVAVAVSEELAALWKGLRTEEQPL